MSDSASPKRAVLKVYFDRRGHAERAVVLLSSGDRNRDRACVTHCMAMTIPMPRIHTRVSGELWRKLTIPPGAVLVGAPS